MNVLNLSENIIRLRHEKKLTQEELADFIGVTKASVSKWENAQSMPDILLLPQLAAFFGVTIDELIGYEAQLTGEQIRRCYGELAKEFAALPFEEAWGHTRTLAHQYYSCYPLLLQLSALCWNHFMMAGTEERGRQALQEAIGWCGHILDGCSDIGVCGDALVVKAGLMLCLGKSKEVIEILATATDPSRIAKQDSALLVQAYQMAGELEDAKSHVQIGQYTNLLNLVGNGAMSLSLYENDMLRCEETIQRTVGVMELFQLESLHPNIAAQFYYQAAVAYAKQEDTEKALGFLKKFEVCIHALLDGEPVLHGDGYFDLLDAWIDRLPLGNMAPRDKGLIRLSVQEVFSHPAFEGLKGNGEFQKIARKLAEGGK